MSVCLTLDLKLCIWYCEDLQENFQQKNVFEKFTILNGISWIFFQYISEYFNYYFQVDMIEWNFIKFELNWKTLNEFLKFIGSIDRKKYNRVHPQGWTILNSIQTSFPQAQLKYGEYSPDRISIFDYNNRVFLKPAKKSDIGVWELTSKFNFWCNESRSSVQIDIPSRIMICRPEGVPEFWIKGSVSRHIFGMKDFTPGLILAEVNWHEF